MRWSSPQPAFRHPPTPSTPAWRDQPLSLAPGSLLCTAYHGANRIMTSQGKPIADRDAASRRAASAGQPVMGGGPVNDVTDMGGSWPFFFSSSPGVRRPSARLSRPLLLLSGKEVFAVCTTRSPVTSKEERI